MLTFIHGDDIVTSRKALDELKLKFEKSEKIVFDGSKITLADFISSADSLSLFGEEKLLIVENFFTGIVTKEKEEIVKFLGKSKNLPEIIFWEQKEIGKTILKKYFASAKVIFCPLPKVLFKFLDSIGEKPAPLVLSMFHKLTAETEAEFIFSMLIRQWRYLVIASDLGEAGFADMPSWQSFKFIKQARFFDLKNLIFSYRQLLSLDQKVKMGLTSYSLAQLLDIFFVSLYYQN